MPSLEFLDRVWGRAEGYVQFQQKMRDEAGERTGEPKDNKEFIWPADRDRIGRYLSIRTEEDLYFAVPLYKSATRRQSEVKLLNTVYVDNDGTPIDRFRLPPSTSVQSSPGHSHDYWILSEPADPARVARVGFAISSAHRHDSEIHDVLVENDNDRRLQGDGRGDHKHCGTDPGGWDLTQILRIPGTLNTKPEHRGLDGSPWRITEEDYGYVYTIEQLEAAYPPVAGEIFVTSLNDDALPTDIPDHTLLLAELSGRADLIDLYTEIPSGFGSQGWDERLFALENELFRIGFNAKQVYSIASTAACNKFERGVRNADGVTFSPRPNWRLDLWRDVNKAQQVHMNRPDAYATLGGYDSSNSTFAEGMTMPDAFAENTQRVYQSAREELVIDLLTAEERKNVVDVNWTFINAYVKWASAKTDAALVYHIASAFTILSIIFGEYGHAMPKFGKLRLNLWFLVMGRTTRARKSTSRNLMLKIIDGVQDDHFWYDGGSDFTGEALLELLGSKPKQSTIVHRDEVQGLLQEILTKGYMKGLSELLTELYDGVVRGIIRKGVELTERTETNFVLFLMGIVSKITSVLTLEDFQSGFLARFIHVIGEAPQRTKESEWLDQAEPEQIMAGDPEYKNMIGYLNHMRSKWNNRSPDRDTVGIRFEPDAWKRWNEANWDLQMAVQSHARADILEAAVDRMGKNAIKAAALLAMSEGRDTVNMADVLIALHYTGHWAEDMVRSAEMVSESFWQKDLTQLHDAILVKGAMSWSEAYSKVDKQPNEFKTMVEALVQLNRVRVNVDPNNRTRWLEAV